MTGRYGNGDAVDDKEKSVPDFREIGLSKKFATLVNQRAELTLTKKAAEQGIKELNDKIAEELATHLPDGAKSTMCGEFRVTLVNGTNTSISKTRLLELGVAVETVEAATKYTEYVTVSVTEVKARR